MAFFDGEFFSGEFFNPATTGGGGGGPLDMGEESPPLKPIIYITEPADRFAAERERKGRLREQLRVALEGPQAKRAEEIVTPYVNVGSDGISPIIERIDFDALRDDVVREIKALYEARRREIDDEDIFLLI